MPRGDQLIRQWRLLQLIDRPAGVTVDGAARELGCTRRTIFRDLNVLQAAGFPIYNERGEDGREAVWRITERFKRQLPLKLTLAELAALLMSRDLLAPLGPGPLGPSIDGVYEKIRGILSRDALALIDRMREVVGVRGLGAKLHAPAAEHLQRIQDALVDRRRLQVRYHSFSRDEETDRAIDPYHLTWHDSGLYLVARCHERTDVRIFAVERFRRVQPTRSRFTVPADFDLTAYLENALGIVRGTQVKVRVVFDKSVAPYIRERRWHSSQAIRDLPDGRVEVRLTVADTLEVRRWILGYGSQAEVLEPASLREALRTEAEALARTLTPRRRPLALLGRRPASEQTNGAAEGEQGAGQGRGGGPRLSR